MLLGVLAFFVFTIPLAFMLKEYKTNDSHFTNVFSMRL